MLEGKEHYEVAERLRELADAHAAIEASYITHALGLEYKIYGTIAAFDNVDVQKLADLIDPTCRNIGDDYMFKCSRCGAEFEPVTANRDEYGEVSYTSIKPRYCSQCRARVVV